MIRLSRGFSSAAPSASGFFGQKRVDRLLELIDMARAGRFTWDSKRWKGAKALLKAESYGKCAYCEASTETVAHGDVEHFRPKSIYWWLAYCYDNYLFACQICNQSYKGDQFPVSGPTLSPPELPAAGLAVELLWALVARFTPDPVDDSTGLARADFLQLLAEERALLPDPYVEDPESFFAWSADPVLKEVEIRPRRETDEARHDAVERYFGLNREELKRWRWSVLEKLETLRKVYQTGVLPPALEQDVRNVILMHLRDTEQFAAMSRYFVHEVWRLPV